MKALLQSKNVDFNALTTMLETPLHKAAMVMLTPNLILILNLAIHLNPNAEAHP